MLPIISAVDTVCPIDIEPTKIRTWEPGPKKIPSMGPILGNPYLFMYSKVGSISGANNNFEKVRKYALQMKLIDRIFGLFSDI